MTDVTTLKSAGNSANRVDIVLVAEGYTAAERDKFWPTASGSRTTCSTLPTRR